MNIANPIALIDAGAEMLMHIGGRDNLLAAELIKASILEVLADGFYVGDIRKGPYQVSKGKERLGTQEFTDKIIEKIKQLRGLKAASPEKTVKQLAVERAPEELRSLFARIIHSYEQYAKEMEPGTQHWVEFVKRNTPPNPVRSRTELLGFDMFVQDSGMRVVFRPDGTVDDSVSAVDPMIRREFERQTGIDISRVFDDGRAGSVQSIRSFGQYAARMLRPLLDKNPDMGHMQFDIAMSALNLGDEFISRFSTHIKRDSFSKAVGAVENFTKNSLRLIQIFYIIRAEEAKIVLKKYGFKLVRITSRGTEIYPTMCDFEKREIDHYRVEVDPNGKLGPHTQ